MEMVFHLGSSSVQKAMKSRVIRMAGLMGQIHSFWAMNSLSMSFWVVPRSNFRSTPCSSATEM